MCVVTASVAAGMTAAEVAAAESAALTANIAIASTAASTALSAYGMYSQGQQQKAASKYASAVAERNAQIEEQNAKDVEAAGRSEEQRQRIANSQKLGEQRAAAGASGVDIGTGTMLDSIADTAAIGEYDALTVRSNYQRQANAHYRQAEAYRDDAAAYSTSAGNAAVNGALGAAGTLLAGTGKVASSWYTYTKK
jgi:hypothetical protein